MKAVLFALLGVSALASAVLASDRVPIDEAGIRETEISVSEVPAVLARLKKTAVEATFTVFVFSPGTGPFVPNDAINLQFCFEDGSVGFDWVLLAPPNIRDQKKYERLASSLGYKVVAKKQNGVRYLRTTEGDLARLCERVMCDLYGKAKESRIGLLTRGVQWP